MSIISRSILLVMMLVFSIAKAQAQECRHFITSMQNASHMPVADTSKSTQIYNAARASGQCSAQERTWLGQTAANIHYRAAFTPGLNTKNQESLLRTGLSYGRPWNLLAAVADIEKEKQNFDRAARLYNEALDAIDDKRATPTQPPKNTILALRKKAETAWLLAPKYIVLKNRSGAPGGVARPATRGIGLRKTAIPVRFNTNETSLTDDGRKSITDMFDFLASEAFPSITLIGHSDERGSPSDNLKLSKGRANAVKTALINLGYQGQIEIDGKGETTPFQPDDPDSYTKEQRWQMDRRVELMR